MNILIEGIDRAGKSTLVRELKNRLGWDTRFLGHRPGNQYTRYVREYGGMTDTIIERGHVSEAVYSRVFGRDEPFSFDEMVVLDGLINTSMVVVYARPDLEVAVERYAERTLAQTVDRGELAAAYQGFDAWFDSHSYRATLSYASSSWEELEALVERVAEMAEPTGRVNDMRHASRRNEAGGTMTVDSATPGAEARTTGEHDVRTTKSDVSGRHVERRPRVDARRDSEEI